MAESKQKEVAEFHRHSDINLRPESQHHSIGMGPNEAAAGDHTHDGRTGRALLEGVVFMGSRSSATASVLAQILTALEALGAEDNTTA